MRPTLELREQPYDGPDAQALIAAVQQEYVARYGGPDQTPLAAGGVRRIAPDTAEIKQAIALYSTSGYTPLEGFGHYAGDGGLGFEKPLVADPQARR